MASDDEVQRQLAELSARVDSLARKLEALRLAGSISTDEAQSQPLVSGPPSLSISRQDDARTGHATTPAAKNSMQTLESRIGSQLFNRIGIFAVLIAMAWFLKLAFDRHWIGPGARVLIGLAIAAGMAAWSERFRRHGFRTFSYTLKALGAGIAYLSLWAAASLYHLLPYPIVFLAMVAVTLVNALLAWSQDSELLAVYALAGGLATPALLSLDDWREAFLFSYLLMLAVGALFLLALRPWKRLVAAAFIGTASYYALWMIRFYESPAFAVTLLFTLAFFAAFAAAPFVLTRKSGAVAQSLSDSLFVIVFPVANAAVVFAGLMNLFENPAYHPLRAWTAFALAAVFLLLAIAGPRAYVSKLSNAHLGLAVFFLTVGIPLEFDGYVVTLWWLGAALCLIAVAAALSNTAMRVFGAALLTLAAMDVILLEWVAPVRRPSPVLANAHFATYLIACCVLACVTWLSVARLNPGARQGTGGSLTQVRFPLSWRAFGSWTYLLVFSMIFFSLTALLAGSLEIHHFWFCGASFFHDFCGDALTRGHRAMSANFSLSAWFMLYGAALMAVGFILGNSFLRWQALLLLAFSIGKVFLVDANRLSQGARVLSFLALGVLLLTVSLAYQKIGRPGRRGASIR